MISVEEKQEDLNSEIFPNEENIIASLKDYMEGKLKIESGDLSYDWINKDFNILILNRSLNVKPSNLKKIIDKRDTTCELKLLKLITEDKQHRDKLMKVPKECKKLNRYSDILPYEYNNICLNYMRNNISMDLSNTDNKRTNQSFITPNSYINASMISGPVPEDDELFISTQGPLRITVQAFWNLILLKEVKLIIMLTNIEEDGRKKCDKYWPDNFETPFVFENFKVILESEEDILNSAVTQRIFCLHDEENDTKYSITQLHVYCWPDHSVPEKEIGFKMIELLFSFIDEFRVCYQNSPVLVHCSAGIGRTGTFIAIYNIYKSQNLINLFNKSKGRNQLPFFSVFNVVRKLREQRYGMVTDASQYKYIYEFICEWLNRNFES